LGGDGRERALTKKSVVGDWEVGRISERTFREVKATKR